MKLSSDSPELTAYVLGELSASERAEVEAALASSAELRAELSALQNTSQQLTRALAAEPALSLSSSQRAAVLKVAEGKTQREFTRELGHRSLHSNIPSLRDRILAWRRQLVWAVAGVGALLITLLLLPRSELARVNDTELRYQVRALEKQVSDLAPEVQAPVKLESETLGQSEQREESLAELPQLATGLAATPTAGPPPATLSLGAKVAVSSAGGHPAASDAAIRLADTDRAGATFYKMDPAPMRRYGLVPTAKDNLAVVSESRSSGLGRQGDGLVRELSEPTQLGKQLAESEVTLRYWKEPSAPEQRLASVRGRGETPGTESYGEITDNPFKDPLAEPLSTFGLDVDTASYANVRRFLRDGSLPPRDAVRLEELINYFRYDYPAPRGEEPFVSSIEIAECPWKVGHKLVRVGLQAKAMPREERPRANLVFLLDVSGSMEPENKLPLVKRSLRLLLDRLNERDSVGIVTYAGESRAALEPTPVTADGRRRITEVIESLRAGSGTAGAAGIVRAYEMAKNNFDKERVNRVILCTDGDFNIGITEPSELHRLITDQAKSGVFLSVLGYGMGNLKDSTMELLANKGNGNYAYVDSFSEARKVLVEQLEGTLITVAKDVKVQVEFNPARVASYRLLGYENRVLRDRDFNDDTKDAGEVGAGHQITVLYEISPTGRSFAGVDPLRYQPKSDSEGVPRLRPGHSDELLTLKLRYKAPDGDQSKLLETPVKDSDRDLAQTSVDFKFAAAVAGYGMLLRSSPHKGDLTWESALRLAEQGLGTDKEGYRAEFVDLVRRAQQLGPR